LSAKTDLLQFSFTLVYIYKTANVLVEEGVSQAVTVKMDPCLNILLIAFQ
jgi:hypothetical protein